MPEVRAPQLVNRLSHGPEVGLDLLFANRVVVFGKFPCAHFMCTFFWKVDGILDILQSGVDVVLLTEHLPEGPVGIGQGSVPGRDSGAHCAIDSVVVIVEASSNVRGAKRHDVACG